MSDTSSKQVNWKSHAPNAIQILFTFKWRKAMAKELQHDDHIWLCVGSKMWAIWAIDGPIVHLWRGYAPNLEFSAVDLSEFRPDDYYIKIVEMWRTEGYIQ